MVVNVALVRVSTGNSPVSRIPENSLKTVRFAFPSAGLPVLNRVSVFSLVDSSLIQNILHIGFYQFFPILHTTNRK
jgi:hypothetical protein